MERILLEDSPQTAILKLAGGNSGALIVCLRLLDQGSLIDPDSALGGFGPLFSLDAFGIYEDRIWQLYKDVCDQDLRVMIAVLRACRLGFVSLKAFTHAVDTMGEGLDVTTLVKRVEDYLPNFQRVSS